MSQYNKIAHLVHSSPMKLSVLAAGTLASSAAYALGSFPSLISANIISEVFATPLPRPLKETIDDDMIFSIAKQERYGLYYHIRLEDAQCNTTTLSHTHEDIYYWKEELDARSVNRTKNLDRNETKYFIIFCNLSKRLEIVLEHKGGFMSPYYILGIQSQIYQFHNIQGRMIGLPKFVFTYSHPFQPQDPNMTEDYFICFVATEHEKFTEYEYVCQVYSQIMERLCTFGKSKSGPRLKQKVYYQSTLFASLYTCSCDHFFCSGLQKIRNRKALCSMYPSHD